MRKRALIGRKIVGFEQDRYWDRDRKEWICQNPVLRFDNGTYLVFSVQENDGGEYGVELILCRDGRKLK
jgi:hypothetical protein